MKTYYLILLLLVPLASANIVISQVLFDPLQESGGEAVELRNDGTSSIDIGAWVLATEASESDAVIPENVILNPGETFLVADEGWSEKKDNVSWRDADYEEKITLANTDGGVALIANGSVVDAVGWGDEDGIKAGLFEGNPAVIEKGLGLVRVKDTDDNSEDFVASELSFDDSDIILVEADVGVGGAWIEGDASEEDGVQVRFGSPLFVRSLDPGTVEFGDSVVELVEMNGSFGAVIPLPSSLRAGGHAVIVNGVALEFEYLPFSRIRVGKRKVVLSPEGVITLENTGNVPGVATVFGEDLRFGSEVIDISHVFLEGVSLKDSVKIGLDPGEKRSLTVELRVPSGAVPGKYTARMRFISDFGK